MSIPSRYKDIVSTGVIASIAVGPLGAFGAWDAGGIGAIWTTMFVSIANKAGHELDNDYVKKFIASAVTGGAAYYAGCKAATWLFHLIPGAGTLLAMGISSAMNGVFTLKFGSAVANSFEKGDFDVDDAAIAVTTILSLLCTFPTIDEWKDLININNS